MRIKFEYERAKSSQITEMDGCIQPSVPDRQDQGETQEQRKHTMKKSIITLGCALIAPLAFAQTSTTTTEQTTSTQPATTETTTTSTTASGTVTTYEPGKTIVVKSDEGGPVRFALGTAARIVNGAGKIVTAPLRAGQKVRVYYTGTGEQRVVERVQVEDQD
jgi:hypothetical protein